MQVFMINSGYDGCCYVRILLPAFHNGFQTDKLTRSSPRMSTNELQQALKGADVVVFHRPESEQAHELAKLLKRDGKKIVMDNDDTFIIEGDYPLAGFLYDATGVQVELRKKMVDTFMEKYADLVTTTTPLLVKEYSQHNKNVVMLPNYIDPMDWDEPLRNESYKVRIGLVGSVAIENDYIHIKDIIRELGDRSDVEMVLFGLGDAKHREENPAVTKAFHQEYEFWDSVNKEQIPWCKSYKYPATLNNARLDMMLIPRKDNYFNRCKSNIKFLEAAMCGIPVIAEGFESGDSPYQATDDSDHMLIAEDKEDWEYFINTLIRDKGLRENMGKRAKEYVLNSYNIENHFHKWNDAYEKMFYA